MLFRLSSVYHPEVSFEGYKIFDMRLLFTILENNLVCKCGGNIKMYEESCSGLGGKRSVLAMRIVGGGLESLRSFCGVIDFPAPVQNSSFTKIRKQLLNVTCDVAHKFMTDAVEKEIKLTQNQAKKLLKLTITIMKLFFD
ncbi:hypothetical protein TSAR_008137 [Trichomalopsis sarcophagae]|uniref:Uncharacterized protein n=1 Tax=Trichomalopsis sarcophagae TaxID=543379 RepID=A0A232EU79_9HYME|nr:hypothetical protein TSAR_008137 [Trichomalopsis sarcophagae]